MLTFVLTALLGLLVGVISGMLGIGGGSVMVPLFRLGFALSALQATATSLFAIIPTSLAGVIGHLRNKTCLVPLGIACGIGGALLAPVGVRLASISPGWAVMLAAGLVIIYTSVSMLRSAVLLGSPGQESERTSDGCRPTAHHSYTLPVSSTLSTRTQLIAGGAIGLAAGLAAGYVGLGGGFLMVPLFVSVLKLPMKSASGTSLLAICFIAASGVAGHLMLGNVDIGAGLAIALGTVPGALLGAHLTRYVPDRTLRIAFGILLILVAIFLIANEFAVHLAIQS